MSIYEPTLEGKCLNCGKDIQVEGVHNGVGYVHPPLHCECGWSERCSLKDEINCKHCDQFDMCFKNI